jgi:hypothetical protein
MRTGKSANRVPVEQKMTVIIRSLVIAAAAVLCAGVGMSIAVLMAAPLQAQQPTPPSPKRSAAVADCDVELKPSDTFKELSAKLKCLETRIRALEGSAATGPVVAPPPAAKFSAVASMESGGIRFDVENCKKSGSGIVCRVFITSLGKDQSVYFTNGSRSVDTNGVLYSWKGYQGFGEKQMDQGGIRRWFVADVRTGTSLYFDAQIDQVAQSLAVVQIDFQLEGSGSKQVSFRNLSLQ